MKSKGKARERLKPVFAADVGLVCRQFKPGTTKSCGRPAEFWIPVLGDACREHLYGKRAVRYADSNRAADVRAA